MRCFRFVVLALLAGCHLRAGFDAAGRVNGPLQATMTQPSTSRTTGVLNLPPRSGRSYELEAGFGGQTITVNSTIAVHDATSTSFTPGPGYLAATFGLNARWAVMSWHGLSPTLAAGPARVLLLDRDTGDMAWGNAMRGAAGLQFQLGPIAVYGDLYREIVSFGGGPATGTSTLDGVTVGLSLQP